jgi:hypothetical protein
MRRSLLSVLALLALAVAVVPATAARSTQATLAGPQDGKVLFFASDGLRQDLIANYVSKGQLPLLGEALKRGASAGGGGLLTQAPPNTGAGWYTLATGAWPGVHGSTNNTFHIIGQPFANRTAAARRLAGSPDRVGRWASRYDQRPDRRLPCLPLRPRGGD